MTTDPMSADAFTRASVEAYVHAATDERVRLEVAITEARARLVRATSALHRLDQLAVHPAAEAVDDPPPSHREPAR